MNIRFEYVCDKPTNSKGKQFYNGICLRLTYRNKAATIKTFNNRIFDAEVK